MKRISTVAAVQCERNQHACFVPKIVWESSLFLRLSHVFENTWMVIIDDNRPFSLSCSVSQARRIW